MDLVTWRLEEYYIRAGVQQQRRILKELVCSSRGGYYKSWCAVAEENIRRTNVQQQRRI